MVDFYFLLKIEIIVDDSLSFIVKVYGCFLLEDYFVYVKYWCFVRNILICNLIVELEYFVVCCGVEVDNIYCKLFYYVILKSCDLDDLEIE